MTPTTIQLQPLKLVKLHRVLREKNFEDPFSFALVEIRDEAEKRLFTHDFQFLRERFKRILTRGIQIHKIAYRYLHHSMSQVKEKQFWFLDSRYSLIDLFSWMGNFDNERVVSKHAARMAQCFTSTEPSIRVSTSLSIGIPRAFKRSRSLPNMSNTYQIFTPVMDGTASPTALVDYQSTTSNRFDRRFLCFIDRAN